MGFLDKIVGGNINKRPDGPQSPSSQYHNPGNPYPPASSLAQPGSNTPTGFSSNNPYGGDSPYNNAQQGFLASTGERGGDNRPLPDGWVKQWNEQYKQHFYVDTASSPYRANPPRSIWVHPLDDPEFQRSSSAPQGAPQAYQPPNNARMFGMGGQQGPPQGYGGGYNGPAQGYGGYPPQQGQYYGQPPYQQQPVNVQASGRKKMGGMGMGGMLAAGGAGLLGGALLGEALSDHSYEEGYENGYDNGYDNGFDNGDDFGGGDFGDF